MLVEDRDVRDVLEGQIEVWLKTAELLEKLWGLIRLRWKLFELIGALRAHLAVLLNSLLICD